VKAVQDNDRIPECKYFRVSRSRTDGFKFPRQEVVLRRINVVHFCLNRPGRDGRLRGKTEASGAS